jgi:hypothetical protein
MITVINSVNFIRVNVLYHPQFVALLEEVAARSTGWVCSRSLVGDAVYGVGLLPLAGWGCGFESCWGV